MSKIGNIFLVWRKGPGARRITVGKIKQNSSHGTRFEYIQENIEKAIEEGFIPYTGFPKTDKKYNENVIEIFSQRLSKAERNDLSDFYTFWRVNPLKKTDAYYMLSQTQGLLPIDNFEFLTNFNPKKGLNFVTEIAGLTKTKIPSENVSVGDSLSFKLDTTNSFDKFAVKLYKNNQLIGYVKLIHSIVFHKRKMNINIKVHHIEKNGILKRVFIEIKM
ncbi:hypothetical protein [Tenacibaculum finnmarkense]|uniref:hypothetical protein n=1 Tax=Tenacibaculum finnmarkense TaxID=2781243 RepID=UPI000C38EA9B|nr:hypothetical protein [Tenacibaculum finnmarkense]MBE7660956.1 hypothetical protein [Tenacibaculum finnmarkense genomovar finnmarkense]MCG8208191.1 hypothetical protein [Tenacibaculum finnmarkense genomovar finnmarkense]MCG8252584.1 hypothetical protein [Tenacibaculum finnmarkense genomovar finnmarkense]MCG8724333.1 hypothetical protein [Tenacibaculum finnmarkense]MCG8731212.1 hypothetical protein [Tenacibaculum finnmarkense]